MKLLQGSVFHFFCSHLLNLPLSPVDTDVKECVGAPHMVGTTRMLAVTTLSQLGLPDVMTHVKGVTTCITSAPLILCQGHQK